MHDEYINTMRPATTTILIGGQGMYDALKEEGYYVWEVGVNYYLWIDRKPVDIEYRQSLCQVLHQHHFLYSGVRFKGTDYRDFVDICRSQAVVFDHSVRIGITPQLRKEYRLAKQNPADLKSFFRRWMLKYYHPINTL